jgi:hypothetical protein
MATYTVMIHSVPTEFEANNNNHPKMLCAQNNIPYDMIEKAQWLGQPLKNGKQHGTLLINVKDKKLAQGSLIIDGTLLTASRYTPGPPQCFNCLEIRHLAFYCKTPPLCARCGAKHNSKDCQIENPSGACFRCIKIDQNKNKFTSLINIKYTHSPFSIQFPLKSIEVNKNQ